MSVELVSVSVCSSSKPLFLYLPVFLLDNVCTLNYTLTLYTTAFFDFAVECSKLCETKIGCDEVSKNRFRPRCFVFAYCQYCMFCWSVAPATA